MHQVSKEPWISADGANFDRIAPIYRWLEYLTFGPILQQTRVHFLPHLRSCRRALVFGDGDGRFLARLLEQNPDLIADAVDTSPSMLALLAKRAQPWSGPTTRTARSPSPSRLHTHHGNGLDFRPRDSPDLVATHFFLDCLTEPELHCFVHQLIPTLSPHTLWLVSDFRIPSGTFRLPAKVLVRALYVGFRLLTGLQVTHLPAYHSALQQAGFVCIAHHHRLFGIVTAELWSRCHQA